MLIFAVPNPTSYLHAISKVTLVCSHSHFANRALSRARSLSPCHFHSLPQI